MLQQFDLMHSLMFQELSLIPLLWLIRFNSFSFVSQLKRLAVDLFCNETFLECKTMQVLVFTAYYNYRKQPEAQLSQMF